MRMMSIVVVQIFLQLQIILMWHAVHGRIFQWVPNTDFDNPQNWKTGRLPCRNEHVRFPSSVVSVLVQRNNTVLEIVLPNDGEIILGDGVEISFPQSADNRDETCTERVNEYNGTVAKSWFDPLNWCEISDVDSVECQNAEMKYLHTESIPCSNDEVVFRSESRFVTDIGSGAEIRVQSLRIGEQAYTKQTLRQYMNTDAGRQRFLRTSPGGATNTTINIAGPPSSCTDPTGCLCSNWRLEDKICAFELLRCRHVQCPLQPKGHCCPVCGTIMTLDFSSKFRPAVINNLVKSKNSLLHQQETADSEVWWVVSKSESDEGHEIIQLVIADNDDGKSANKVADAVEKVLQDDLKTKGRYGVTHIEVKQSVINQRSHTGDIETGGRISTASIVAVVICSILTIILIAFTVWCAISWKQGKRRPVQCLETFNRWRKSRNSSAGGGDMELGRRGVVFDNRIVFEGSTTSFENVGMSNIMAAQQFDALEVQPTEGLQRGGFANPLYASDPGIREVINQPLPSSGFGSSAAAKLTTVADVDPTYENVEQVKSVGRDQKKAQQQQPAVTAKIAGVLRGMRSDMPPRRRFENEDDEEDDNANVLRVGPESIGYVQQSAEKTEATTPPKETAKKKKQGKKAKKPGGTKRENSDGRHQRLENSTDDESSEETMKAGKGPGFDNPCYDETQGISMSLHPSTASGTRKQVEYKTGFENPVFDDQTRSEVKLERAEVGDSNA